MPQKLEIWRLWETTCLSLLGLLAVTFRYMKLWMNHLHFHVILGRVRQDFETILLGSALCLIVKIVKISIFHEFPQLFEHRSDIFASDFIGHGSAWALDLKVWECLRMFVFGQSSPVLFSSMDWGKNDGGFWLPRPRQQGMLQSIWAVGATQDFKAFLWCLHHLWPPKLPRVCRWPTSAISTPLDGQEGFVFLARLLV